MRKISVIFTIAITLSACGEKPAQTKTYYMDNDVERKSMLAWCADRPDQEKSNGNCINAGIALLEKIERLKQDRILIREKRWDTRSSLLIEREKCGAFKTNETFKPCRNKAREDAAQKNIEMQNFNSETDALVEALR